MTVISTLVLRNYDFVDNLSSNECAHTNESCTNNPHTVTSNPYFECKWIHERILSGAYHLVNFELSFFLVVSDTCCGSTNLFHLLQLKLPWISSKRRLTHSQWQCTCPVRDDHIELVCRCLCWPTAINLSKAAAVWSSSSSSLPFVARLQTTIHNLPHANCSFLFNSAKCGRAQLFVTASFRRLNSGNVKMLPIPNNMYHCEWFTIHTSRHQWAEW